MWLFSRKPAQPAPPVSTSSPAAAAPAAQGQNRPAQPVRRDEEPWRKKVLLMGQRHAGKTAARQVVFHRLRPDRSLYVDMTTAVVKEDVEFFVPLQVWEIPGSMGLEALEEQGIPLAHFSTLIYMVDAADDYNESLRVLHHTLLAAHQHAPHLHIAVFAHKSDAWDEFYRADAFRQIQERTLAELEDHSDPSVRNLPVEFYLTSVMDSSVFEAFARVVQRLVPGLTWLEQVINYWSQTLDVGKCFLFDIPTRLYIATDASPVDFASHDACSRYIADLEQLATLFTNLSRRSAKGGADVKKLMSASSRLSNDSTIAYWQITGRLALVALVRTTTFENHRGAMELNVLALTDAVRKMESRESERREKQAAALEARREAKRLAA